MIFQRALRRELNSAAGAVFTTLFSITISVMLIRILGQAAVGKVASADVIALIGFTSLMNMHILLILTGFIAVLLVITRSYQDSEMVVWFASGQSLKDWIAPVLRFGLPLVLLTGLLSFVVTPWAYQQSAEFRERFEKRSDIAKVTPGKFQQSSSANRIFFVEEVAGDLSKVQNIFVNTVFEGRSSIIVARQGTIEIDKHGDKFLVMTKGSRYDGLPTEKDFQMMQFEKYGVLVNSQGGEVIGDKTAKSMPLMQLLDNLDNTRRGELLWRISLPLTSAALLLLAIPLGFVNPRVGRSANLIVALLLVVIYLSVTNIMQALVVQGKLSLGMAWWPEHLIVLVLAWLMFSWRLQNTSYWHPTVVWSRLKACAYQRQQKDCK